MFEIDGHENCYNKIVPYIKEALKVGGATAEVGLRRAGTTKLILDVQIELSDRRPHICIDPYGQIPYSVRGKVYDTDYSNDMRYETLRTLYQYAQDNSLNVLFFNMEDSEFYNRFQDYVPVYEKEKIMVDSYCFVHVDGQHSYEAVLPAAQYFMPRVNIDGYIAFDNTDSYDHARVEREFSLFGDYDKVDNIVECGRTVYKRAR